MQEPMSAVHIVYTQLSEYARDTAVGLHQYMQLGRDKVRYR